MPMICKVRIQVAAVAAMVSISATAAPDLTDSMEFLANPNASHWSDSLSRATMSIHPYNGKLYVSNSGGLNYPNYGNTVSVIDIASFTVTKEITVVINPTRVKGYDNRYVYVVSNGDYGNTPYAFQKIDCQTDEVVKTYDLEVYNFDVYQNLAYVYSYNFSTMTSWIKVLDLETDEVVKDSFISDGTQLQTPYGIKVNPLNGDVYITDAGNFTVNGDVYCFDQNGNKKFSFEAGLNPSAMAFNN